VSFPHGYSGEAVKPSCLVAANAAASGGSGADYLTPAAAPSDAAAGGWPTSSEQQWGYDNYSG